jgi:ribonuclease HI
MSWIRRAHRGCKVWVEIDDDGAYRLTEKGLARVRYKKDDARTYTVRPESILEIEAVAGREGSPRVARETRVADRSLVVGYTDGSSLGNPGPAGVGIVLTYDGHTVEISEFIGHRTNNFAELVALERALRTLRNKDLPALLHTDSAYCHGVLARGHKAEKNADLVSRVRSLLRDHPRLEIALVRGHAGVPLNERAHELATRAARTGLCFVSKDGKLLGSRPKGEGAERKGTEGS